MTVNSTQRIFIPMKKSQFIFILAIAIVALAGAGCANDIKPLPAITTAAPVSSVPPAAPAAKPAAAAPSGKLTLKVVKVDSEETAGEDGKGANAVDGDPNTIWHTQWQDNTPPCPHEIIIELVPPATIKGFTYLPRQDDSDHGNIKDYEFYVSADGVDFGQPVKKGTFENSKDLKTVTFDTKSCRFIKLKALSEANDSEWTSAAEITVVPAN
jgi:F5/8 type C domain